MKNDELFIFAPNHCSVDFQISTRYNQIIGAGHSCKGGVFGD
ncbi:MAG TPA: hypothetical protein VF531_09100 [Bacillota bacterium]